MILWVRNRKRNKNSNSNKRTNEYGNWIARRVTNYLIVIRIVYSIWSKLLTLQFKGKHFDSRKSHFKRMQFQNKRLFDKMIIVDQSFCKLDAQSTRKEKVKQCWHRLHTKPVIIKTHFHLNFFIRRVTLGRVGSVIRHKIKGMWIWCSLLVTSM